MARQKAPKGIPARRRSPEEKDQTTLEERVKALEHAAVAGESAEKALAEQIVSALAEGEDPKALQQKRREIRDSIADIKATLPGLRERIITNREALARVQAADRVLAIRRAYGSLLREYEADEVRVVDAAREYHRRVGELNARFKSINLLAAEASALGARFGVELSKLAPPVVPALRKGLGEAVRLTTEIKFLDHGYVRPDTETDEHGLRTRRTYEEIRGTNGFEIINAAGLPMAWPELTKKQQEAVAAQTRDAEKERAFGARIAGEIHARERVPERKFG